MRGALLASLIILLAVASYPAAAQSTGGISISTYFTGVSVQAGQPIYTSLNITNSMAEPASISISTSAPPGWTAVTSYNGYNVTAVYAPAGATPGTYEVNVTAWSG
jgi:uncharacterized membrane protein